MIICSKTLKKGRGNVLNIFVTCPQFINYISSYFLPELSPNSFFYLLCKLTYWAFFEQRIRLNSSDQFHSISSTFSHYNWYTYYKSKKRHYVEIELYPPRIGNGIMKSTFMMNGYKWIEANSHQLVPDINNTVWVVRLSIDLQYVLGRLWRLNKNSDMSSI